MDYNHPIKTDSIMEYYNYPRIIPSQHRNLNFSQIMDGLKLAHMFVQHLQVTINSNGHHHGQ